MNYRADRINSEFQREIAAIIRRLKDPRLTQMISVTDVHVAKDLKTAKVAVAVFGANDEAQNAATFEALCHSAGFIRKELASAFHDLRTIPELTFILDKSRAYSDRIEQVIQEIKKNDHRSD